MSRSPPTTIPQTDVSNPATQPVRSHQPPRRRPDYGRYRSPPELQGRAGAVDLDRRGESLGQFVTEPIAGAETDTQGGDQTFAASLMTAAVSRADVSNATSHVVRRVQPGHPRRKAWFKLLSVVESCLARSLMSDEAWRFFERFILTVRAPNGRRPTNHRLGLDGIGSLEPGRHGVTFRKSPANGRASTASSGAGRWQGCGRTSWMP